MTKKEKINADVWAETKRTMLAVLASFIYSAAMNLFVTPVGMYSGGLIGICQVIRTLLVEHLGLSANIDIASIIYFLLNLPLLYFAWHDVSHMFFVKTIISVAMMTVSLAFIPVRAVLPDDVLASASVSCPVLVGGLVCGAMMGIVLRSGGSGGGFDIVGVLMILRRKEAGVGQLTLFVNAILFATCFYVFGVRVVIYSMLFTFVYSFALDKMHSQNINVEAKIITKKGKEIEAEIFRQMGRGVTEWASVGAYTGQGSTMLYVLMSKYEIAQLRSLAKKIDPSAFIVISSNVRVYGNFLKKM